MEWSTAEQIEEIMCYATVKLYALERDSKEKGSNQDQLRVIKVGASHNGPIGNTHHW